MFIFKYILDEKPVIVEITLKELFFGSENFVGMQKIFEKFFDTMVLKNFQFIR